jgi:hypothetical protein
MPRIVWENNQLLIYYQSADDLIKFLETAVMGPAKQFGLSVEVRKEEPDQDTNKKTKIQTVRM